MLNVVLAQTEGGNVKIGGPYKLEVMFGLTSVSNTYASGPGMNSSRLMLVFLKLTL